LTLGVLARRKVAQFRNARHTTQNVQIHTPTPFALRRRCRRCHLVVGPHLPNLLVDELHLRNAFRRIQRRILVGFGTRSRPDDMGATENEAKRREYGNLLDHFLRRTHRQPKTKGRADSRYSLLPLIILNAKVAQKYSRAMASPIENFSEFLFE